MNKRETGSIYEDKAVGILRSDGYEILERNYGDGYGEIDIICSRSGEVVFVEVKYRKTDAYGEGYEAVDKRKMRHIYNTALKYIGNPEIKDNTYRFDCISFLDKEVKWMKNVMWGDEFGF